MELKFKNKTESIQQIMLVDGSGINIIPGGEVLIDIGRLFADEIKRLQPFFSCEEIVPEKNKYAKPVELKIETESKEGGN